MILSPANDESYTPSEVIIQAGDCKELLLDVTLLSVPEGASQVRIDLVEANDGVSAGRAQTPMLIDVCYRDPSRSFACGS